MRFNIYFQILTCLHTLTSYPHPSRLFICSLSRVILFCCFYQNHYFNAHIAQYQRNLGYLSPYQCTRGFLCLQGLAVTVLRVVRKLNVPSCTFRTMALTHRLWAQSNQPLSYMLSEALGKCTNILCCKFAYTIAAF